jgi:diaminohydroxyphosphoribosylaminopyrimidine deaminase / 5-amino-6-(5-phosphoribosylamino)uracil reductase
MPVVSIDDAMRRALELAALGPTGPNPRVGCVVLDRVGRLAGAGWHQGAGTPHAEAVALEAAGPRAAGGTAVVTLEPCAHRGRTGPCTELLAGAGVVEVVYGHPDPNPLAAGGAGVLAAAGVTVSQIGDRALRAAAGRLIERWAAALALGRPYVTLKLAATLDGRAAAPDGSSQWITGPAARADGHRLRAEADTVLVGTGTAVADDPQLTVRDAAGGLAGRQPLRAVMGLRTLPPSPLLRLRTRDPATGLAELWDRGSRHVLLEGGPTLGAAFLVAGLVDEVVAYVAPALLGAGPPAVGDLGITTIGDARRFVLVDAEVVGGDVRFTMRPG